MRKDLLVKAITNYDVKRNESGESDDFRISLLKQYLDTDEMKEMPGDADISISGFAKFAMDQLIESAESLDKISNFLSPTFLANKRDRAARIMAYLLDSSSVIRNEEDRLLLGNLGYYLPDEIIDTEIPKHLSAEDIGYLSQTSSLFHERAKGPSYWLDKLKQAGCDPALLKKLEDTHVVNDYKTLYEAFDRLPKRIIVDQLWQLLCLSGNPRAVILALSLSPPSPKDNIELGIVHYTIFSGNVSAIKICLDPSQNMYIKEEKNAYRYSHLAAQSGSVEAINYFLKVNSDLFSDRNPPIENCDSYINMFVNAIKSKNTAAAKCVMDILTDKLKINKEQLYAELITKKEILLYAVETNNPSMIRNVISLYDQLNEHSAQPSKIKPYTSDYFDRAISTTNPLENDLVRAISFATESGKLRTIKCLFDAAESRQLNFEFINYFYNDFLMGAIRNKNIPVFDYLMERVEKQRLTVDCLSKNAKIPLICLAAMSGDVPMLAHVWERCSILNCDPLAKNAFGANIILHAVQSGKPDAVVFIRKKLDKLGLTVSIDEPDNDGITPRRIAQGKQELTDALTKPLAELLEEKQSGVQNKM
jgi:hypothetical protein